MGSRFRLLWMMACSTAMSGCTHLERVDGVVSPPLDSRVGAVRSESPKASTGSPTSALSSDPDFIEDRARQAYETGRWDVAEGYYLQLTRLKPGDAGPWFQLGNLYAEQGRLTSAERAYREALRRRDDAQTLHNLGLVQVKLGVGALRESQQRLPRNDPARQETDAFLRALLETLLP